MVPPCVARTPKGRSSVTDQWVATTWSHVRPKDFVRIDAVVYLVERAELSRDSISVTVYNPKHGRHPGARPLGYPVDVRTVRQGVTTDAGKRLSGRETPEDVIRRLLDAELLAVQRTDTRKIEPWIFPTISNVHELGSHLFMFHELAVPNPKAADAPELRRIHAEMHRADPREKPETARRIPHIHHDAAFKKEAR